MAPRERERIPHDYTDRTTRVGDKPAHRGAVDWVNPAYWLMADGSIRKAA
jgi:hypothetical protein